MNPRLYTKAETATWTTLYQRLFPCWQRWASRYYLRGLDRLALESSRIPQLPDLNQRLHTWTSFTAVETSGYMPPDSFFGHLRRSEFPTVTSIRRPSQLDYLPEPDIFHDVAGHVPMHTDPTFARVLNRFGALAACTSEDPPVQQQLARFFWFTIEFGLISESNTLKAYGSGLLSSFGELEYALTSPQVLRLPFRLSEVMATPFEIDHFQNRLYVIDSFEQLYSAVAELESSLPLVSGKKNTSAAPAKK